MAALAPGTSSEWITDKLHSSCVDWRRQLFEAVIAGNASELTLLLESTEYASIKSNWSFDAVNLRAGAALQAQYQNPNHHQHFAYQYTCLHYAVVKEHVHIVQMLLDCDGLNVNSTIYNSNCLRPSLSGMPPIMLAVENGNFPIFQLLIDHGAMLPRSTDTLCFAATCKSSDIFRYILCQHGISGEKNKDSIDLTTIATHEHDVLTTAINERHIEMVEILLEFCKESPDDIGAWFNLNNWARGIITLYRYAVALPAQHLSLLTFHMCRHHVAHQLAPESRLQVFNTHWPPVVGYHIECFLLPSKKVRRTMQKVVNHFEQHLLNKLHQPKPDEDGRRLGNGHNLLRSLLLEICTYEGYGFGEDRLEMLSFLLANEQLEVNKLVLVVDEFSPEDFDDAADEGDQETCLRFALRLGGFVALDVNAKMIAALVAAGGVVRYERGGGDGGDGVD